MVSRNGKVQTSADSLFICWLSLSLDVSSSSTLRSLRWAFTASSEYILMFCFSIFNCGRSLICYSNLSFHPGFDFLSVVLRSTPIFPLANFAPGHNKSLNSVMLFVGILAGYFGFDCHSVLVPERRDHGFLFGHDSFHYFHIHFPFKGQRVCVWGVLVIIIYYMIRSFWFSCI